MRSIKYIAFAFGINTPTKCVQLLNTAYPEGSYGWVCEISSDNIADNNAPHYPSNPNAKQILTHYNLGTYDRTDDEMYRFEPGVSSTSQDSPSFLWNTFTTVRSTATVRATISK